MNPDLGALGPDCLGHVERRRVTHIIGVWLERGPENRHVLTSEGSADHVAGQVNCMLPPPLIDPVDLLEEVQRIAYAEFTGSSNERPDVFWQTPTSESEPRREEMTPDPFVVS